MSKIQVDTIVNKDDNGAPDFPNGATVTGIVTATSFVGDGSGLTGAGPTVGIDTTTNDTNNIRNSNIIKCCRFQINL
jgi:hypothetical protein